MSGNRPKRAMVLAAGLGKRLRPVTDTLPKPLIAVGGHSLLDWSIAHLADAGIETVVLNLHHLGPMIEAHLADQTDPAILYSHEESLLDTGGGITKALPMLGDDSFFAANGDSLWLNGPHSALERMIETWDDARMDGLLMLHSTVEAYGYTGPGDFCVEPGGELTRRPENDVSPYAYTGVQILHPRLFEGATAEPFSLNRLYDKAIAENRLFGMVHDGEWFHVGTPEGLAEAEAYMRVRYAGIRHR